MIEGRTVFIIKDKEMGSVVTNCRPDTGLPLMWKLLTATLSEDHYAHLERKDLLQRAARS